MYNGSKLGALTGLKVKDGLCGICPAGCWVRFSLGESTTKEDIDCTVDALAELHNNTHDVIRFVPCR